MSRNETYPWSLLTEVGDYFCVPSSFKPYQYVSMMVAQKNYRLAGTLKYTTVKTTYGCIVLLCQVSDEEPAHEFVTPEGILASTSRRHLIAQAEAPSSSLGERPSVPKRTVSQITDAMHWTIREANLPWWFDPRTRKLVVNPKLIQEPESSLWMSKEFNPDKDDPYPEHYHLDQDLMRKTRDQIMAEEAEEAESEEEEDWGPPPTINDGEDSV